jgi:hypothetical protein
MKKLILLLSIIISISACSSLDLQAHTSSEEETRRILALGLSYEENLIEANKISDPHMVTVVSLQLANARDEKIQSEIDLLDSKEFANGVIISANGTNFIGPKVSKSDSSIININPDLLNYHIEGSKNLTTGAVIHKLIVSLRHNSESIRNYTSANLCDQWSRCDSNNLEFNNISETASNCSSSSCHFTEIIEINLNNKLLRDYVTKGFTVSVNSIKNSNKVKLSSAYLMGYLEVAN